MNRSAMQTIRFIEQEQEQEQEQEHEQEHEQELEKRVELGVALRSSKIATSKIIPAMQSIGNIILVWSFTSDERYPSIDPRW